MAPPNNSIEIPSAGNGQLSDEAKVKISAGIAVGMTKANRDTLSALTNKEIMKNAIVKKVFRFDKKDEDAIGAYIKSMVMVMKDMPTTEDGLGFYDDALINRTTIREAVLGRDIADMYCGEELKLQLKASDLDKKAIDYNIETDAYLIVIAYAEKTANISKDTRAAILLEVMMEQREAPTELSEVVQVKERRDLTTHGVSFSVVSERHQHQ